MRASDAAQLRGLDLDLAVHERELRLLTVSGAPPSLIVLKRSEIAEAKRRLAQFHATAMSRTDASSD